MVLFKLSGDDGAVVGVSTCPPGFNVGDGRLGKPDHGHNASYLVFGQKSLRMTAEDATFDPGHLIDFQVEDTIASLIKVTGATIELFFGTKSRQTQVQLGYRNG